MPPKKSAAAKAAPASKAKTKAAPKKTASTIASSKVVGTKRKSDEEVDEVPSAKRPVSRSKSISKSATPAPAPATTPVTKKAAPKKTTTTKSATKTTSKSTAKPAAKPAAKVTKKAAAPATSKSGTKRKRGSEDDDDEEEEVTQQPAGTKRKRGSDEPEDKDEEDVDDAEQKPAAKRAKTASTSKGAPKKAATTAASKVVAKKPLSTKKPAPKKTVKKVVGKKAASEPAAEESVEPESAKSKAVPKRVATKPATKAGKSSLSASESDEPAPAKKAAAPKKALAPKKAAAPKAPKPKKALPVINTPPTQVLDIYVFGEGSSGELGLGSRNIGNKKVIDVKRPRLNERLSAKDVGVVMIAVGGMHCVALTKDNKIYTWGVNDQGALGRETPNEGKMEDLDAAKDDDDSDSDDEDSGLNPTESEPRVVESPLFTEDVVFAAVFAGDSVSFALTTTGLVYGWGTFRSNEGILGFRPNLETAYEPMLIPELKNITMIACGTNHVLALDTKGKVFTWGAGEQSQLARRIVARTATGSLIPREFGLGRKRIVNLGCGDYNSFAVDDKGNTYAWGLNTFSQCGVEKAREDDDTVIVPTLVESLKGFQVVQITGGAHHTLALSATGDVLVWGRCDTKQSGLDLEDVSKEVLYFQGDIPKYLKKPVVVPEIDGAHVATANDTCLVVDKDGKAHSWGFSENYQTGQGVGGAIVEPTWIDNTAVRGKKLVFAGVGGQFGVLGGIHSSTNL